MHTKMDDSEEIVMTAAKRDGRAIMRLERMFRKEIDDRNVHHVAGGAYKGILINKAADNLKDVEPAEGRLEFLAYLVNEDQNNESLQDYWTLRFWFRGRADGIIKKKTFTDYFQELMNPSNFPKNYIGFIKKALILLRGYHVIKRVELEVQETEQPPPEETLPPIQSFTSVFTPAAYTYQLVPEVSINDKTFLTFMVKAAGDAHISLSAVYGELDRRTFEIVIGTEKNTKSLIRYCAEGPVIVEAITMNIVSEKEFRYFWISWEDHHLEVGRGAQYGYGRFLDMDIPTNKRFNINCLAVSTGTPSRGQWEFAELLDEFDFGRSAKRKRVKDSLLWIAKKQKMLQCLEDAYPNALKISELLKQCKVKQSDMMAAVVNLNALQTKGLIKEVEEGFWMRIQSGGDNRFNHEVKLVKDLPQLTGHEQPTIAIVTSLYCEKLAVDAMIDDKTTFVKYKTEGDSQVYTLGKVGRFKVVCTKLSNNPGTEEGRISAENTITRLLGTFNKVKHVLLVGVGGAVPNYTDGNKHVRLGDVVVSMPSTGNDAVYVHCSKIEKVKALNGYSYDTKEWASKDKELQRVVTSLKDNISREKRKERPWDEYIEDAADVLKVEESSFHRPSAKRDRLYYTHPDGTVVEVKHPKPTDGGYQEGKTNVRYGVICSGKLLARTDNIRLSYANMYGVLAFNNEFDAVLDSLEGNRNESFLLIRGISDYADGGRKEWQPYASLAAAAYMKAMISAMSWSDV